MKSFAAIVAGAALVSGAAAGAGPETGWLDRPALTGDWGGGRTALREQGLLAGARYTAGFWSNVRGGFATGTRVEGFAEWWLEADLETLVRWRGASFSIDAYSYHGGQPSTDLVGPFAVQTVSGWETSATLRVFQILLRQEWGDGRFELVAGQLAADSDFFLADDALDLLNGTWGFLGTGRDREILPFFPLAAPGARLRARTDDARWEAQVGVYTGESGRDRRDNHGFGWSFGPGVSVAGELRARRSPLGLPGSLAIGVAATTAPVEDFATGGTAPGSYTLYALFDQRVLEPEGGPSLGLFLRGYGAPQPERNPLLWYVDAGIRVGHPLPGRDEDVLAFAVAYTRFSDDYVDAVRGDGLEASRRSTVMELTYRLQLAGWLTLQPNVQIFLDPHTSRRDATVLGLRAVLQL